MADTVGIRELRQNASDIISAAEAGRTFHVTVRGKDTGVTIGMHAPPPSVERRRGVTLRQIEQANSHEQPVPDGYEAALLNLVEAGRDASGRVGDRTQ